METMLQQLDGSNRPNHVERVRDKNGVEGFFGGIPHRVGCNEFEAIFHLAGSGQTACFSDWAWQIQECSPNIRVPFNDGYGVGSRTASQVEKTPGLREIKQIRDLDSTGTSIGV